MLRPFLCFLALTTCGLLQGCGSSGSTPTPPVPPQPQISITAPGDGSTVNTLPATVSVNFSNGADPGAMKALLDGVDVTAQFAPADSSGTRQAQVDRPAVNLGKNQVQIVSGSVVARSSFVVALGNSGSNLGASATLPLLIPIQSRVLTGPGNNAVDYNFSLYEDPTHPNSPTYVRAPEGPVSGFQVAYLSRIDLSVVSNQSLPNPDPGSDNGFVNSLLYSALNAVPAGCPRVGCLLLVQSLQTIGYTPCSYGAARMFDCSTWTALFTKLGGSGRLAYVNESSSQVAYSFIRNTSPNGPANSNVLPGTYYERLTCSATTWM